MASLEILNSGYTIFPTIEAAEVAAEALRSEDPDWEYRVIPDPLGTGKAIIKSFDEDGNFLGNM